MPVKVWGNILTFTRCFGETKHSMLPNKTAWSATGSVSLWTERGLFSEVDGSCSLPRSWAVQLATASHHQSSSVSPQANIKQLLFFLRGRFIISMHAGWQAVKCVRTQTSAWPLPCFGALSSPPGLTLHPPMPPVKPYSVGPAPFQEWTPSLC